MLTQKLYKNGNSVVVTIPKDYLEELNFMVGSKVILKCEDGELIVSPKHPNLASDVDPKFMQMVDQFIIEHEDVLRELANK